MEARDREDAARKQIVRLHAGSPIAASRNREGAMRKRPFHDGSVAPRQGMVWTPTSEDLRALEYEEGLLRRPVIGPLPGTAAELFEGDSRAPSYLLDGIIPAEGAGGLIAPPKRKKTWFLLGLAVAVAKSEPTYIGRSLSGGPVLFLALEMTREQLRNRLLRMAPDGASGLGAFHYCARGQIGAMEHGGLDDLRRKISEIKPALVVLDGWAQFRPAPSGQSLYDADYGAVDKLRALAHECHCAILFAHHVGKRAGGRAPSTDVIGTHGLGAAASFLLSLDHNPRTARGQLIVEGNEVPTDSIPLSWNDQIFRWEPGEARIGHRPDAKLTAAEGWLRETLAQGPVLASEVIRAAQEAGVCGERTLRKVKARLGIRSEPPSGPTSKWVLP